MNSDKREPFDITPEWAGLLPYFVRVAKDTKNAYVLVSFAFEVAKLGKAAQELFLRAIDPNVKEPQRQMAENDLIRLGRNVDHQNTKPKAGK